MSFTKAPPKMKYFGMNLKKYVQDLHEENYKTLMNEIKELNKQGGVSNVWIGSVNIVKISVLPNLIYRFDTISVKIPASYFVNINKLTLKFIWRGKIHRIANTILKEKNKVERLKLPSFNTHCEATVVKTVWYW